MGMGLVFRGEGSRDSKAETGACGELPPPACSPKSLGVAAGDAKVPLMMRSSRLFLQAGMEIYLSESRHCPHAMPLATRVTIHGADQCKSEVSFLHKLQLRGSIICCGGLLLHDI